MQPRLATADDRDALRQLINHAFVVERVIKKSRADRLDEAGSEMDGFFERGKFLLLEEANELRGCVYVELRGDRCYLGLLSVTPGQQGKGIGRRLNLAAEDYAKEQGCRWMDLRVVSPRRDELVPFYVRLGYAERGTQDYPPELAADMEGHFILMTKQLM